MHRACRGFLAGGLREACMALIDSGAAEYVEEEM